VDILPLYRTVVEELSADQIAAVEAADYLTFTSSSTVTNFLTASGSSDGWQARTRPRLVSIGPVTSGTLREHGLEPDVEATRHDIDGLIEALVADVANTPKT
jgi:uroporphyrinogen-III synthase